MGRLTCCSGRSHILQHRSNLAGSLQHKGHISACSTGKDSTTMHSVCTQIRHLFARLSMTIIGHTRHACGCRCRCLL